ncbi:MAG: S1 RNA-binding domain-containing protein [Anaerolineales bacterium]|nr:S1 RNA-binding domain-containing protein [Anaerolineales bacterium]
MKEEKILYENTGESDIGEGWWAAVMEEDQGDPRAEDRNQTLADTRAEIIAETDQSEDINWELIEGLYRDETVVTCTVVDFNKGGLLVCTDEFQGFVPISHLDEVLSLEDEEERIERLRKLVGCRMFLKVIECDQRRGRVVLSERAAQSEPGQRQKLMEMLAEGARVMGRVTNLTDFGVFVDLGGVEGLIHISELSWGRVIHPSDHATINENIEVLVLSVNRDQCRVSLSVKRLKSNPWKEIKSRYPVGTCVHGVITDVVKFGAFARLDDGLEGLIHISEMGSGNLRPEDVVNEGQEVNVEVLVVDSDRQRMSLRLVET